MASKSYLCLIGCALTICTMPVWAGFNSSGLKLSAYGGFQYSKLDPGSFILLGNQVEVVVPNQNRSYDDIWGLGVAYRLVSSSHEGILQYAHDITLGLDTTYFQAKQQGDVMDYAIFENFDYQLKVHSWRFLANAEWTFPAIGPCVYPFIVGGLGLASNSASYSDIPDPDATTSVGINIPNANSTHVAYDVGAGINIIMSDNLALSLRYLYLDAGSASTSHQASLPMTSPITISLRSRSLMAGLSYLF